MVTIGSFFTMNLILAQIIDSYLEQQTKILKKKKEQEMLDKLEAEFQKSIPIVKSEAVLLVMDSVKPENTKEKA